MAKVHRLYTIPGGLLRKLTFLDRYNVQRRPHTARPRVFTQHYKQILSKS